MKNLLDRFCGMEFDVISWGSNSKMIIYKVFCKNYELKQGELIGALAERRKGLRGKTRVESGLRWARLVFGQMGRDKQAIFVVPYEVNLKDNIIMPVDKMVFTRQEFLWMIKGLDQESRRKDGQVHNTIFSQQW